MTPALEAAVCLLALPTLRRLGLVQDISSADVSRGLGVARSYAYEKRNWLQALLGKDEGPGGESGCDDTARQARLLTIANAVLRYLRDHPGAWCDGRRNVYSAGLRAFVLALGDEHDVGHELTQADFAAACEIPLPTLKAWWAQRSTPAAQQASPDTGSAPTAAPPDPAAGAGFTLEMLRVIRAYESWEGTLEAFVHHLRHDLNLHYGRQRVTHLLHLAAARKLLRKPPPPPPVRRSTLRPPPGVQWSSDGKEVELVIDGQSFVVTWQPMVDVGSAATVGTTVRPTEDSAGVIEAFGDGVVTTGAPPHVLLLDNKAANRSDELAAALPDETLLMHSTLGRAQNKAVVEGAFGLFAQDLGRVIAVVDTTTPLTIALSVADAVTRAYATGRNHRPRRRDGKSRHDLFHDRNASPDGIAAAVEMLRRIKDRIDTRAAREAARRDPRVQAQLEHATARFGFAAEGDLLDRLRAFPLETIESAIAIYASKQTAGSLPVDAGLRYFGGIVRNVQHERELEAFANELIALLEARGQLLAEHLHRQAASLVPLDHASHLAAVVDQLLTVPLPAAQSFWRQRLTDLVLAVPVALHTQLRHRLCKRVRRCFAATKHLRRTLSDLLIRLLTPEPSPLS